MALIRYLGVALLIAGMLLAGIATWTRIAAAVLLLKRPRAGNEAAAEDVAGA